MNETDTPRVLARVPITIRWRDLDALNHVNNAMFLTYLEEARLVWLEGIEGDWMTASCKPVLASTQIGFRGQVKWPGEVVVELFCARLGTSSLTLAHRITSSDGLQLYCDGSVVMVWIDPASGCSVPLPVDVRTACV